jgi:hypothetical protein
MTSPTTLHASCLCGQVRWEVDGPIPRPDLDSGDPMALLSMSHCHCSRCRKAHGAPYATYVAVREATFRITAGRERAVHWRSSSAVQRPFCATCGSVVPDGVPLDGWVAMPAGNFVEDPGLRPTCHIFTGSKAPWSHLDDALPRFDAYPEGLHLTGMDTRAPLDPDSGAVRGSCLCGGVTYVITAPPVRARTCHCSRCRKAGSAAHLSWLAAPLDGVQFTRGEDLLVSYKVPEARYFTHRFCRVCGSSMPRKDAERQLAFLAMGSLDDDPKVRPASHIYAGSRAAWDEITDGLPQYEEMPPA